MQYFAPLFLFLSVLPTSVVARNAEFIYPGRISNGADRTITWRPWQQNPTDEFRFRTGDRYLGRAVWEHYLGFEQFRTLPKAIKPSMIRLGNDDVGEKAVLRPGSRYAIFKVTNGTLSAHKGVWRDRASDPLKATRFWVARLNSMQDPTHCLENPIGITQQRGHIKTS
jgi:hypothetical protein